MNRRTGYWFCSPFRLASLLVAVGKCLAPSTGKAAPAMAFAAIASPPFLVPDHDSLSINSKAL
jgi:hypothetical protein